MTTRIMLSLRKAADLRRGDWSILEPPSYGSGTAGMKFLRPQKVTNERKDDIMLSTYIDSERSGTTVADVSY